MAETFSGSFITASAIQDCDPDGFPDGWGSYSVFFNSSYQQFSLAAPMPDVSRPAFWMGASARGTEQSGMVTGGSLTRPNLTKNNLLISGGNWQFFESQPSQSAMDAAFPPGLYELHLTRTNEAERSIRLTIPSNVPPIPRIVNFEETQSVNPNADFVLKWNEFSEPGTNGSISITIYDSTNLLVFQAPYRCPERSLLPTATEILIPANTLRTNQTFSVEILFGRMFYFSTNDIPQMAGFGQIARRTSFSLKTGGGSILPAVAAILSRQQLKANGNPEFSFSGTIGRSYSVERTSHLGKNDWQEVGVVTIDTSGQAAFEDTQASQEFSKFYRVVAK